VGQHPEDAARNSMMISSDAFIAGFQGGITQLLCKQESERCIDQLGEQLEMGETTFSTTTTKNSYCQK